MTPQEIAKQVVIDHLADGVPFSDVYEHWSADDVEDEELLRQAHTQVNVTLMKLIGQITFD